MKKLSIISIQDLGTFDGIAATASPEIQQIAYALRDLIAEVLPGVTEVPWSKQKVIGYGVGPKKMSEHFCYISPHKAYANLGFIYGADLEDPDGLLEGVGKKFRHIKVRSLAEAKRPALKKLLKQASRHLPR